MTIAIEQHRRMWTEKRKTKVKNLCNVSVSLFLFCFFESWIAFISLRLFRCVYFVSLNHENFEFWPAFTKGKPWPAIKIVQFHEILSDNICYLFNAQRLRICIYSNAPAECYGVFLHVYEFESSNSSFSLISVKTDLSWKISCMINFRSQAISALSVL